MRTIAWLFCLFLLVGCLQENNHPLQGYIEGEYTHMSASVPGRLLKLYVSRGQSVVKGQPLFDLDPEPESAQLQKAASNLAAEKSKLKDLSMGQRTTVLAGIVAQREQAEADLELAKSNFNRTQQLYQKGVVSRSNYDEAESTLKSTQQRVNQYEQNLKEAELGERQYRILQQMEIVRANEAEWRAARWRLTQKSVLAPEAGFIFDTFFNEGEEIPADQSVLALLAPRFIRLIFFVPEALLSSIKLNQQITFRCDRCQHEYVAKINFISPQAEYTPPVIFSEESRQKLVYRIQGALTTPTARKVHPGQPVNVYLRPSTTIYLPWWQRLWPKKK